MARGWESKGVESQIEAAEERVSRQKAAQLSAQAISLQRERESIELSRTRVLQDLAAATHPKYRALLEQSLRYLDDKLQALNSASRPDLPE
jgi:molecular chaperone GrpE (heat shock protein)